MDVISFFQVPKERGEWKQIMDGFYNKWNFPHCVGAIDGKHVNIKCPKNTGSLYFNYKQHFSIVLLALVDDNYNFTCIDVGSYGSRSDGGIFSKSSLQAAIENNQLDLPENSVILGDDAFPLKDYMMKPYPRRVNQCLKERVYNYRHCRARRIVENAFGILASRFRIFLRVIDLEPEKVVKIVKASCAMHNWIRKRARSNHGITVDVEDVENGTVFPGSWRADINIQGFASLAPTRERNYNLKARDKRNGLADYFMGEGAVDWQLRMVNFQATAVVGDVEEEVEEEVEDVYPTW